MKSLFLDSAPNISFSTPTNTPLHYTFSKSKSKGYPFLGAQQSTYGHFVNLNDAPEPVRKLLEVPESATEAPQPVPAYSELLKAEKVSHPPATSSAPSPALNDKEFKEKAKDYLNDDGGNTLPQNDYEPPKEGPKIVPATTASLVNELAAVAETKKKAAPSRKRHAAPPPTKKMKVAKPKKLTTSFRIVGKKK